MRLREEIRRPASPDTRGMRDERRRKRDILRQQKEQVKRIKKPRRPVIHPKEKGDFPELNFKINGMTCDEARIYQIALRKFIANEKSLQETSDDLTESEEELPGGKCNSGERWKSDNHGREATVKKRVSVNCRTIQNLKKPIGEERNVKKNRRRTEKVSDKVTEEKTETAERSPKIETVPIMECRVLLKRLSSEIAEGVVSRPQSFPNFEKRRSSDRSQSSPTKSAVSAGGIETNEEDDYLLDGETILGFLGGNHTSSIHIYSPSHPTLTDEEDSSSLPILTRALPSQGCPENCSSPPLLSPAVGTELWEDWCSPRKKDKSLELDDYHELCPPQQRFSDMVSALVKTCGYSNVVCVEWNHSAKPSEIVMEKLSDCQLDMLVTAVETSLERFHNTTSMLCKGVADLCVPYPLCQNRVPKCQIPWQDEIYPSFTQQEINVAFQVTTRNVNCVSGDYSVQQGSLQDTEDVLKIEMQLKKNRRDF